MRKICRKRRRTNLPSEGLIITPDAYKKLLWFRDSVKTEVGAMGLSSADDALLIEDFSFIEQECTSVTTEFDQAAQSRWIEDMMLAGRNPETFMRVWVHTHPGASASPSGTDWSTFSEIFSNTPWGVMLILGQSNEFSCTFRVGKEMTDLKKVFILPEEPKVPEAWVEELKNIKSPKPKQWQGGYSFKTRSWMDDDDWESPSLQKVQEKLPIVVEKSSTIHPKIATPHDVFRGISADDKFNYLLDHQLPKFGHEEVMLYGPCKAISELSSLMESTDWSLRKTAKGFMSRLCFSCFNDWSLYESYELDKAASISVIAGLQWIRQNNKSIADYIQQYPHITKLEELTYLEARIEQGTTKHFLAAKATENIYDYFSSTYDNSVKRAAADIITSALFFSDFTNLIDQHILEGFIAHHNTSETDEWLTI